MLAKNLTVFFPCPKNLNKAEFRKHWTQFLGQGTFVRAECVGCGVVVTYLTLSESKDRGSLKEMNLGS